MTDAGDAAGPKKSMLYTRTGDEGFSSLYNGERRRKDNDVFETLGALDETNARVGLAAEHCQSADMDHEFIDVLRGIQSSLLDAGSSVATPLDSDETSDKKVQRVQFPATKVPEIERWIDRLDGQVAPLTKFILPGGGLPACHLHLARTAARTAERCASSLTHSGSLDPEVFKYLNRLSDFLFAAARYTCSKMELPEVTYKKT